MKDAVDNAIAKNEPIEEIPKDVWEKIIFESIHSYRLSTIFILK